MKNREQKYPIEVAVEKTILKIGRDVHRLVKFYTTIPKTRQERDYWIMAIIAWFLGVIVWTYIVAWAFRGAVGY